MSASANTSLLPALRERVAAIGADGRARTLEPADGETVAPLGHGGADRTLGGGLRRGAIHEIHPATAADAPAATGFALACVDRLVRPGGRAKPWLWVRQDLAGRETGEPYGPGLAAFGLDPSALLIVAAADARDVLRAAEEGLRCRALGAVLVEPWGDPKALDLTAARRLTLTAEASGVPALMLRTGAHAGPPGAATRWRIAAAPSSPLPALGRLPGLGRPVFAATLERLRQPGSVGEGGSWTMEWDPDEHLLRDPVTPARARPAAPGDGPAAPADAPYRRAG